MQVRALSISGAWEFTPTQHHDDRGMFVEWYQEKAFIPAVGQPLKVAQANHSVSRRGTLRGLHFADVPPGQAKYVYCPRGAVLDVVVDLRVGSPTFGQHDAVLLDEKDRRALYLAEGLGHGFFSLADDSIFTYLCSHGYQPTRERTVHPLDPQLALPWPADIPPLVAPRDENAPTLEQLRQQRLLPSYNACLAHYERLSIGQ